MKANIRTCNSAFENGSCVGGYHEIHIVHYLSSTDHLIATIDSIIRNNLLYGCKDVVLEEVHVVCDSKCTVEYINRHIKHIFRYPNVKIFITFAESIWLEG